MSFSKVTGLCVGHLNIYHLPNKVSDLKVLLNKISPHIFGISETKIKHEPNEEENKISSDMISINNYVVAPFRRDIQRQLHTGLAVYVHESISKFVKRRHDLEVDSVECIWLEFKNNKAKPELIGFVYRNPACDATWFDNFTDHMDSVINAYEKVTMLGDFNINLHEHNQKWMSIMTLFNL